MGRVGTYIFRIPGRKDEYGIHAGREGATDKAGRTDWNYATHGCIRTTEDVMIRIFVVNLNDPLTHLIVKNTMDEYYPPDKKTKNIMDKTLLKQNPPVEPWKKFWYESLAGN